MTLVHDLPLNSKVLIWRESSNWTRPYHLLAVENETYYIQLFNKLTSFRSISIKPYFQSKNTCAVKLDKLKTLVKLDEPKTPIKLDKLKAPTESDKLEAPLPTLEVS